MAEKVYVSQDKLLYFAKEFKAQDDKIYQKAETGKGLSTNDYTTDEKEKLAGIAEGANKITNTSDLTNDSGFITTADIPEGAAASTTSPKMDGTAAVGTELAFARGDHVHPTDTSRQAVITGAATTITDTNLAASRALVSDANGKVAVSDVTATEISYLDGVTSAIQTQLNGKAASAASLAGYGITDAYTKKETDNAITAALAGITGISFNVVTSLPETGTAGTFYLVADTHSDKNDSYDEYIYTNGAWEKLGNTDVDLSGYVKNDDLVEITNTQVDSIITTAFAATA